jgi:cell division protein FtsB
MSDKDDSRVIDSLRQRIAVFDFENSKIKAENLKLKAENDDLKARIAKLEDKQTQKELIKNLLSVSQKLLGPL